MSAIVQWFEHSLGLEWKLTFSSPVATNEFSRFADIEYNTFTASSFRIWNSSTGIPSAPLALFVVMQWTLRPTWLHIPGCLALGEWSHHRDYLGCKDLDCTVLLCILATSSQHLLSGPYHFCSLLSPSLHEMFPWSNFLEEISSLSHSIVYLYVFALIAEEGFLVILAIPWNSAFKWVYPPFSPLLFTSLLFRAICKASSDSHFAFLHFFFLGWSLLHSNK